MLSRRRMEDDILGVEEERYRFGVKEEKCRFSVKEDGDLEEEPALNERRAPPRDLISRHR